MARSVLNISRFPIETCYFFHFQAGTKRSFYQLWELLRKESDYTVIQCELIRDNKLIRNSRSSTKEFQGQIQLLWDQYDADELETSAFLDSVSQLIGVQRDFSDYDPDYVE
jgi:hypothetical protein